MADQLLESGTGNVSPKPWRFWLAASLLFVIASSTTIKLCKQMAHMEPMQLAEGWTMSMMWMRMPGQTWPGFIAAFMSMWMPMTIAMMTPVLLPTLARYRSTISKALPGADLRTAVVASSYFLVWGGFGLAVFVLGLGLSTLAMHISAVARLAPLIAGVVISMAGLIQVSTWKARQLHCCMTAMSDGSAKAIRAAWADGYKLGLRCVYCCAPLTAILIVLGAMDIRVMAIVTLATVLERTCHVGVQIARLTGAIALTTGTWLVTQASV